jgi:hypothetical protein
MRFVALFTASRGESTARADVLTTLPFAAFTATRTRSPLIVDVPAA